jgi:hypothetical protein
VASPEGRAVIPISVGVTVMVIGIALMLWHWWKWSHVTQSAKTPLELRYGLNQFRRRAIVGSMMALTGAILVSLAGMHDIRWITLSILVLLVLLLCILVLAVLDLLHVIVYLRLGPASRAARARLIDEYRRRQQEKANEESKSSE